MVLCQHKAETSPLHQDEPLARFDGQLQGGVLDRRVPP